MKNMVERFKKWFFDFSVTQQILGSFILLLLVSFSVVGGILFKATELSANATNIRIQGVAALIVIFLVVILGEWNACRIIVYDIKELTEYSEDMANGKTDFTVKMDNANEFGYQAKTIENMQASIHRMVVDVNMAKDNILQGNLLERADVSAYNGDYKVIMMGMNELMDAISDIIKNIKESSVNLASSSNQMSGGAQQLSQGATEQASSIEQLSATISEIADHVQLNANNASTASQLANKSCTEIEISNRHMEEMVAAISQINESSSQIGKIIKTIEDIAFQTNILALNAAVEAARAGAAGKGFAVVADEVRNLAGKSAQAAKDTTTLIENSIALVENGTVIADQTAQSLNIIIDSTKNTSELISEIANATNEQAAAISQVMQGVDQISSVVQTNSATAEESAASSEELNFQAQRLKTLTEHFKLVESNAQIRTA